MVRLTGTSIRNRGWRRWACLLAVLWFAPPAFSQTGATPVPTDEAVAAAMGRLRQYLWQRQDAQGRWLDHAYRGQQHEGGPTALVVAALLAAGESSQQPRLRDTLRYLQTAPMRSTYAVSLRAHVWAAMSRTHMPGLLDDYQWLLRAGTLGGGRFGYNVMDSRGRFDHSCTHFGALGIWEAVKAGAPVPDSLLRNMEQHYIAAQNSDGGWGYQPGERSKGSMTAAALAVLFICQQQIHAGEMQPPDALAQAIQRGLQWLDQHFHPDRNPPDGDWLYYYLFALERAGLSGGIRTLNRQDWFEEVCRFLLQQQRDDGGIGDDIDSAFALWFLARGRHPVWVSKLQPADPQFDPWNNRPNDIANLTRHLSDLREADMQWQMLPVNASVRTWLTTPVLYLASNREIVLGELHKDRLKQALDLGAVLIANPDGGSGSLEASIIRLAGELYPQYPIRRLPPDHPLFSALIPVGENRAPPVLGVSNGVRELILVSQHDWGHQWQAGRRQGDSPGWQTAINLWMAYTAGGDLPPRLTEPMEPRIDREDTAPFVVARVRHGRNWNPEPLAWLIPARILHNHEGVGLLVEDVEISQLRADLPLAHLAGVEPVAFSDAELDAMVRYGREGGTLLVETVGGRGGFARDLERQLSRRLGRGAAPLDAQSSLLKGDFPGGQDVTGIRYRRLAAIQMSLGSRPRLEAFIVDERPAIVISDEDISLGLIGCRLWNAVGYESSSARRIALNLVQWVRAWRNEAGDQKAPAGLRPGG